MVITEHHDRHFKRYLRPRTLAPGVSEYGRHGDFPLMHSDDIVFVMSKLPPFTKPQMHIKRKKEKKNGHICVGPYF